MILAVGEEWYGVLDQPWQVQKGLWEVLSLLIRNSHGWWWVIEWGGVPGGQLQAGSARQMMIICILCSQESKKLVTVTVRCIMQHMTTKCKSRFGRDVRKIFLEHLLVYGFMLFADHRVMQTTWTLLKHLRIFLCSSYSTYSRWNKYCWSQRNCLSFQISLKD